MALDLATFNPKTGQDLAKAITGEISGMGKRWWESNSSDMQGYVRSLAEAAVQTSTALAEGRIEKAQAQMIMEMQKTAYQNTLHFTKFMTMALAQNVLDETLRIVGAAVMNRTGLNLWPTLGLASGEVGDNK